jgi:hypothetical protein
MKTSTHTMYSSFRIRFVAVLGLLSVSLLFANCAITRPPKDSSLEAARVQMLEGAITRDQSVIQSMLAPDFAWREDVPPIDEEPYDFWNRHKLWGSLREALQDRPVLRDGMWIAPKSALRESYRGPRIAWRRVGAEWRLAYFFAGTALAQ